MKIQKNEKLKEFMSCYKEELGIVIQNLEKSKSEYEKYLRKFIGNHICSSHEFRSRFNKARKETLTTNPHLRTEEITKTMILETIICNEIFSLEKSSSSS